MIALEDTGPAASLEDRLRASVRLVSVDDESIEWAWRGSGHAHTHALTSSAIVDALEGLDGLDHHALRVVARWREPYGRDAWSLAARRKGVIGTCVEPVPFTSAGFAIWAAPRRERERLYALTFETITRELAREAFERETAERVARGGR